MYYEPSTQTLHATVGDFRAAHPLTSYGPLTDQADREAAGLVDLIQIPPPHEVDLQTAIITGAQQVGSAWHATYTVTDKPLTPEQIEAITRERSKQARAAAVAAITVTTQAGHTFDGDETSQTRMSRAILVLSTGAALSVPWVLADNTVIQADAAELAEALALAGAAQAAMWVI